MDVPMFFVYVLELEHNKWYVGKTFDLMARFDSHRQIEGTSKGATWTAFHKPLKAVRVIETTSLFDEDKYTKQYMALYGIDNVRGGSYVTTTLSPQQVELLCRELRGAQDCCLRCGSPNHYVIKCPNAIVPTVIKPIKAKLIKEQSDYVMMDLSTTQPTQPMQQPIKQPKVIIAKGTSGPSDKVKPSPIDRVPSKSYAKWTAELDTKLCRDFDRGVPISEIARKSGRTKCAIESRLDKLGKVPVKYYKKK
jgi:predicted GIY-YIG superfamily endonuclease